MSSGLLQVFVELGNIQLGNLKHRAKTISSNIDAYQEEMNFESQPPS